MTAVDSWIADLQRSRYSATDQNLISSVDTATAALAEIQSGLTPIGVELANTVYAGPAIAPPALPTFRSLVGADIPIPAVATRGGVFSKAAVASNFLTSISSVDGSIGQAQPAITNLSGLGANVATLLSGAASGTGGPAGSANPVFTGTITPSSTGGIVGTTTNDNAQAGSVGEFIESVVTSGSPVALTTGVTTDFNSVVLTAGDWDVEASVITIPNGATVTTNVLAGFNTAVATLPATERRQEQNPNNGVGNSTSVALPRMRFSLSAGATIRVPVLVNFSVNTLSVCGYINARRVR